MPWGSCRLDVESRGTSLAPAPPARVCVEVYPGPGLARPLALLPQDFLPDLRLLESNGMINSDTAVLCDWNLYPGTQDGRDEAPQACRWSREHTSLVGVQRQATTSCSWRITRLGAPLASPTPLVERTPRCQLGREPRGPAER